MIRTRTTVILAVALAVVVIVILRATILNQPRPAPAAALGPRTEQSTGTESPAEPTEEDTDGHPHDQLTSATEQARRLWTLTIKGFGRNFTTNTASPSTWRTRLQAYSTAAVQRDIATIDPAKIPAGRYTGFEVLEYHDHRLVAKVRYAEGWAMALYLVDEVSAWKVDRYDRYEE